MSAAAEETTAQANLVSAAAEEVSSNARTVSGSIDALVASIHEIAKSAQEAAATARQAVDISGTASTTMDALGRSSAEIGKVVKVIHMLVPELPDDRAYRVVFLDHGQMVQTGTPQVIFSEAAEPRIRSFLQTYLSRVAWVQG
jgi:hypothetical protein